MLEHQKFIKINGFDVPEPLREAPEIGTKYFVVELLAKTPFHRCWIGDSVDISRLELRLIHLTEEAAQIHINALLSFTAVKGDK